jgi:hypothetical protein
LPSQPILGVVLVVPSAARLGCWLNAWIAGRTSADEAITGITAGREGVAFRGLEPERDLPPAMLLGEIRRREVTRVTVALPVPGDLTGLGGPDEFNLGALDVGQAVLLSGTGIGMVPDATAGATTWLARPADPPPYLPDLATADRDLRAGLLSAADTLARLDVASWSPDAADAVLNLRAPATFDAPMTFCSAVAARLVASALRCVEIVRLALGDDGGALTAAESASRREALVALRHASSSALVAACSSLDGR